MKVGITIPNYFAEYLSKIANLNGSNPTHVCSLIVENFLSYNLKQKKFPLFRKDVRIVFANEVPKSGVNNPGDSCSVYDSCEVGEQSCIDRNSLIEQLELVPEDPEDSGLPFDFESED